jgi:rhamnosyl/mannosyltransferase
MGLDLAPFLSPSPAARAHAAALRARHGPALWLSVGRCVYYKGYVTALRALRGVPGTLIVVGQGPYRASLMASAVALGVADRVVWRAYVPQDELVGAYHAAAALWFPSNARSEAFGLVQVEAMASGCPVINTAIPHSGVPWVSRHEQTGLTTAVDDAPALAAAANRLLADPALRARLADAGRRRAVDRFADGTMAARSLDLYRRAVAAQPSVAGAAGRDGRPAPAVPVGEGPGLAPDLELAGLGY